MQKPAASPLVTVVISSHNYGKFIGEAIASVVAQDYRPLRIVVVDDGSTDGTEQIVKLHMNGGQAMEPTGGQREPWIAWGDVKDVPITVHKFSRAYGPAHARNWGIKSEWKETDIFAILDADDIWKADRVSMCVSKFQEHPGVIGMVYTDYETKNDETGLLIREFKEPYSRERLVKDCIATNACFISKEALQAVGLYDEGMRVAEDWDLFLRISERFLLVHIPESTVYIRVHGQNSTSTVPMEVWQANWRRVIEKAKARAQGVR